MNSFIQLENKNSMLKRDSRTNQAAAKNADRLKKAQEGLQEQKEKCLQLLAQHAEKKHRFLSNQVKRDRFIAANATRQGNNPRALREGYNQVPSQKLHILWGFFYCNFLIWFTIEADK